MAQPSVDLSLLEPILAEYADQKGALIPILQHAQDEYGYLPAQVLAAVSKRTGTPLLLMATTTFASCSAVND